jgi:hypothetical protein
MIMLARPSWMSGYDVVDQYGTKIDPAPMCRSLDTQSDDFQ